ncbi:precorrin-6y C5,15-methyltransferase (decarboxylating) subunit CbiE [Candidatus Entotheonella palauensis]|uniref:precorrin-6y C5,15-methyltransferase (decarboxylating) subunit CbiE n=1 Tax=Candidatus Entotheonella palauensis TaxID=93172 RepID=UPI000B7E6F5C|nr:precorrin-6y C5,15-methyltransferase (decarboxylating) subunit CbiE [Candidatus Entotheonella palauensis]
MTAEPLVVIGIGHDGADGLSQEALTHIHQAKILAGGVRHLAFFPQWQGKKVVIDANLKRVMQQLEASRQQAKTVVLASGDPLFYGIGRTLAAHFPPESLSFLPHVSSVQLAFARLKTSWHDAQVVSLHGRPIESLLPALSQGAPKMALFTDAVNHPAAIARFLLAHGYNHYDLSVCEELGGTSERVTHWALQDIGDTSFSPLNIVVLMRHGDAPTSTPLPLLGLPEQSLAHRDGMITKREIRLLTLGYLALHPGEVLWDIGAGSGSVALEAARLSPSLRIFAVEKDGNALRHIVENVQTLATPHVQPIHGEAPAALAPLPDPDAVFIGGSGGRLPDIVSTVADRLRPGGRVVMNCITLENFTLGWSLFNDSSWQAEATSVQLAHTKPLGQMHRFASDSPIFIIQATKL